MPQVLNNEVDILNVANIDNDIRDSYTRAMIAGEEKETYSTNNYDVNEFFIWNDRKLYRTLTAVSIGDTFVLNTNIKLAGDISDQLYELFAQSPESIREVISNIEEGATATKNYHAGDYFIWNDGFLYKVTAATINIGTAFVVNTNVVKCDNVTDELTSVSEALTNKTDDIVDTMLAVDGINMCDFDATSAVINGVTFSNNNGVITLSGSLASGKTIATFVTYRKNIDLKVGKRYKWSGCPSGGGNSTYHCDFIYRKVSTSAQQSIKDIGGGIEFECTSDMTPNDFYFRVEVESGAGDVTGKVFKPMLTPAEMPKSDYDHFSYYAKTNRELTVESDLKFDRETYNGITIDFTKVNGIVTMNIYTGTVTNALSSGDAFVTVPAGFRPYSAVQGRFTAGAPDVRYWYDTTDKTFEVGGSVAANVSLRGTITYVAEQ